MAAQHQAKSRDAQAGVAVEGTGKPLFLESETAVWDGKLEELNKAWRANRLEWRDFQDQNGKIAAAQVAEAVSRAQLRYAEYLDGLLLMTGSRGVKAITFNKIFSESGTDEFKADVSRHNTPETRRALHSILSAIEGMPEEWNDQNFRRFLAGTGDERRAKFSPELSGVLHRLGWQTSEITALSKLAVEDDTFGRVLRKHGEAAAPEVTIPPAAESHPDFVISPVKRSYQEEETEPRLPIDREFIKKLCVILEKQGLAELPVSERKTAAAKTFKSGAVLSVKDLKSLPLPARVRVQIERRGSPQAPWQKVNVEQILTAVNGDGTYTFLWPRPGGPEGFAEATPRSFPQGLLQGAMFLGPWQGKTEAGGTTIYNFEVKLPEAPKKS